MLNLVTMKADSTSSSEAHVVSWIDVVLIEALELVTLDFSLHEESLESLLSSMSSLTSLDLIHLPM